MTKETNRERLKRALERGDKRSADDLAQAFDLNRRDVRTVQNQVAKAAQGKLFE